MHPFEPQWETWFAWHPVWFLGPFGENEFAWLEFIERKEVFVSFPLRYEYRLIYKD